MSVHATYSVSSLDPESLEGTRFIDEMLECLGSVPLGPGAKALTFSDIQRLLSRANEMSCHLSREENEVLYSELHGIQCSKGTPLEHRSYDTIKIEVTLSRTATEEFIQELYGIAPSCLWSVRISRNGIYGVGRSHVSEHHWIRNPVRDETRYLYPERR